MPDQTEDLNINTLRKLNQTRAAFLEDISCYQFAKLSSQTPWSSEQYLQNMNNPAIRRYMRSAPALHS